jgi:A/G-specific adenine glycosylase
MLTKQIISWYLQNKRDLPWRETKDPYQIWISEIMLQQTRVSTVVDYFNRFMHQFPSIADLAKADEQEVLKLWQGLGYYSRARNLHETAKTIQTKYSGIFPESYQEILTLKGIGSYTAAAIASFAFNLPYAAVDGNVYRVLSRLYGIEMAIDSTNGKKYFQKLAQESMNSAPPEIYNQAIIEFGALQCIPKNPNCDTCPFLSTCYAYKNKLVDQLPNKSKQIKTKNRYFYYLFLSCETRFLIEKRELKDIWKNLYQYPLIEYSKAISHDGLMQTIEWKKLFKNQKLTIRRVSGNIIHKLSHQNLHTTFIHIEMDIDKLENKYQSIDFSEIADYPFPKLIEDHLTSIILNKE